jgi:hypothetical protein
MLSIEPKNCRHSINILLQVDSDSVKKQPETIFIYSLGFFGNVSLIDGKFPYFTQFKHGNCPSIKLLCFIAIFVVANLRNRFDK